MEKAYFDLRVRGNSSNIRQLKVELLEMTSLLNLPMNIIEEEFNGHTTVSYLDETIKISSLSNQKERQQLNDFLLKINPKTGKICKCSDCKNCPSKNMTIPDRSSSKSL